MLATVGNRFNWWVANTTSNGGNTQGVGTSLTSNATANTVGTTVEILSAAQVTEDVYGVQIIANFGQSAGTSRNYLYNILVDPAGGTNWSTVIPNLATMSSGSLNATASGGQGVGVNWYFPLFIKAGSSIAANCQCSAISANTFIIIRVFGRPSRPELLRVGAYVTDFGANTATSLGTALTVGANGANGAYAQLGSNTTRNHWWWQTGCTINDSTVAGGCYWNDLAAGDATNKDLILENVGVYTNNSEIMSILPHWATAYCEVPSGVGIYGRSSANAAADTAVGMTAYGLGG